MGQRWPDCDSAVALFIDQVVDALQDELGDSLVGVYLHGSLALGSYYPPKSDIDLLIVVRNILEAPERESLSRRFVELSKHRPTTGDVEVSAVAEHAARNFEHPMPYEMHYSTSWNQRIERGEVDYAKDGRDHDLAAHVSSVRESGVALFGPMAAELFAPVPEENFLDSILDDLEWIVEDDHILESPYYGVLNGCRVLLVLSDRSRRIPSKEEGALWALEHVPDEHRAIISAALDAYRSSHPVTEEMRRTAGRTWDRDALLSFRDYLTARIRPAPTT